MFIRYLRKADRTPFGAVVGLPGGGIGVSVCRKTDTYDKAFGRQLAAGRALEHDPFVDYYCGPELQGGRARTETEKAVMQIRMQQMRARTNNSLNATGDGLRAELLGIVDHLKDTDALATDLL